jgi:hypothetical protein
MLVRSPLLAVVLAAFAAFLSSSAAARAQPLPDCQAWPDCRDRALEARENRAFERFHDLAWRAVQTGPRDDPGLMYLLARAQALSGRRRDALVMLRRLADMGVATDAAAEEDFRRTRELPGWLEIERRFESLRSAGASAPASPPAAAVATGTPRAVPPAVSAAPPAPPVSPSTPAPAPAPPAADAGVVPAVPAVPRTAPAAPAAARSPAVVTPPAPPRAALVVELRAAADAARFSTDRFSPAGLAYDEVSGRFLFGDMIGRRLFVLGERSDRTIDLVRAEAAGFHDITALEIDTRRGDLWVASTAANGKAGAIHKLQLVSGRSLTAFEPPAAETIGLIDLAIASSGTLLVLDAGAKRVLRLRPGASTVETAMNLAVESATSLAIADSERSAYVAHAGGILRLDLQQGTAAPLTAPDGLTLAGFERIRWHRSTLVGIQMLPDGMRGLVQLQLKGSAVTTATLIDRSIGGGARPASLMISGEDAYYSVLDENGPASDTTRIDVLVRRVRLK